VDLRTRCPACQTAFRVTAAQLRAMGGQVRCGRCEQVFDAFSSLLPGDSARGGAATEAVDDDTRPATSHVPAAPQTAPAADGDRLDLPLDLFLPRKRAFPWRWAAACVPLLLLLALQGIVFHATALALWAPGLRGVLGQACATLRCTVGYARVSEQLSIETSELQVIDPTHPALVMLTASLHNLGNQPQEWPMLEVTLTGDPGQPPARRVLRASEYAEHPGEALRPGQELPVRLYLDAGALHPQAYRLLLFFPPAGGGA
jgi:predicted Zn finger-like uncharacterized protein